MHPCFKQLFHGDYCHLHAPPKFGFFDASSANVISRQDSLVQMPMLEHPSRNQSACVITPSFNIP
ncbi:hypothetical protein EI981_17675 [Paenibacillus lutimineralis]|uniref:Uncharacterized protein n=1 Tax=Paenibacillus lutimineralis TaxID=2707005 RepID=A0A3Q9I9Z4_9BACL|nr:hypothetical protein EI981_17675 [Paenibacillus lutimineralis]